jgi:hypothetical protein
LQACRSIIIYSFTRIHGTNFIPNKDDIPARCRLKIARSTLPPEWLWMLDNGGYTVWNSRLTLKS